MKQGAANIYLNLLICKNKYSSYFVKICFFAWFGGLLSTGVIAYIDESFRILIGQRVITEIVTLSGALLILVFSPLIESAILAYCITISRQAIKNNILALFAGSIPIALLHSVIDWRYPICVVIPFFVQAVAYTKLRTDSSFLTAFWFICLIHSCCNACSLVLIQLSTVLS